MENEKKLFLVDAYAIIFRAYYAFINNPRVTSYGLNTNAIFGFTNTLLEVLEKQKPTHIAVVFDHKSTTLRAREHEFYKANRDETPEDIKKSEPFIRELVEAFNIPILEKEGYEADDVICTLAQRAEKEGFITYMMTPDKDFGQIVTDKILMYKPGRAGKPAEVWGPQEVCDKFGINRTDQVIDMLGLMGDAVDNIPGVPGVGPKTAAKLLQQYDTMEGIYENLGELKGKLKERLEENKEQAEISKYLATIVCDVPVEWNEQSLIVEERNDEAVRELFEKLEFRGLTRRLFGKGLEKGVAVQGDLFAPSSSAASGSGSGRVGSNQIETSGFKTIDTEKHNYQLVDSAEARQSLLNNLLKQKSVCFDTETTGLDPLVAKILGLALSYEKGSGYYIPFGKDQDENKQVLEEFREFFESDSIVKIAQNLKYDLLLLRQYGMDVKAPFYDTMLAHYLIEPDQRHNMDALAAQYLNYKPISITSLIGKKGKNQLSFDTVPLDKATEYAVEDADITLQLKETLDPQLDEREVRSIFEKIELPLVPVLAKMEENGVNVDVPFLENYSKELAKESAEVEKTIYELAGGIEFNIASPKQMGEVLFDHLKLDSKAKKTKTGQYKTDEETLMKLADKHEMPAKILEYRQLNKLKSTYVDAIPKLILPNTGRVHTSFAQTVAATGRLSSNNPNLQNIPIRTDKGREIRKAFIPAAGNIMLAADYSQIELRVIASVSEDEGMMEAFKEGIDIHTATASKVFDVPLEEVDSEMRRRAKTVNFGIIYGISAFGLSQRIGISRTEAKDLIDAYFEEFSGIKKYMDETIKFCRENGYVKTVMGRRRYIRDINSNNRTVVGFAERNAINAPIQGSAADMIKIAMIKVDREMTKREMESKMILQVHDELLFDVVPSEQEELTELVKTNMEGAMPLEVPVVVDSGFGKNWLEAH
jgi:DNA polymerase-1